MRLRDVFKRELQTLVSGSFPLLLLIFAVPLAFSLLFGLIYSQNTVKNIAMVIYDQEQSSTSRSLIRMYEDSERFSVQRYVDSQEEFEAAIARDEALVGLGIPRDFSKDIKRGTVAETLLVVNSANNMFGNAALSSAQEIQRSFSVGVAQKLIESGGVLPAAAMQTVYPVHFGVRILNNPTNGYTQFMLAGLMLNGLQISLMLIIPLLLIRELREPFYGKSLPVWKLMLGSGLVPWLAAVFSGVFSLGILVQLFDVPMRGSWLEAALLMAGFAFFVIGALLIFSACAPNEILAMQAPMLYIMPGLLYSGLSWPQFAMTDIASVFGALLPITYTGDTLRDIMLAGYAPDFWSSMVRMMVSGLAAALIAGGIFSLRRRWMNRGGVNRGVLANNQK